MERPDDTDALISVIVPVFDVGNHVAACLSSLRDQTDPSFEVIVVDDGSRDASRDTARATIGDDPRFTLIHQDNRGLSGARNAGLARARGDLIAFVDGDDRVAPDFLAALRGAMARTGADWVACAIVFRHDDPRTSGHGTTHSTIHGTPALADHAPLCRHDLTDWRDVARHFPSAWNKLYRRSLIDGLTFPEGTWFEDHGFYWRTAARTDHIVHLNQPLYIQTRGRAGQITGQDDDRVTQQFDVLDDIREVIAANGKSHGDEAFTRIASRLIFERSTALRMPDRRTRYAAGAARFLQERGLSYAPEWDGQIAQSFALELAGELPLSIVLPWDGRADLAATLDNLAAHHGPGREILVVCDDAATAARAPLDRHPEARALIRPRRNTGTARAFGMGRARGRFVCVLDPGTTVLPGALQHMVDIMLLEDVQLGLIPFRDPGGAEQLPFFGSVPPDGPLKPNDLLGLNATLSATVFDRAFLVEQSLTDLRSSALILRAADAAPKRALLPWIGVHLGRRAGLPDPARLGLRPGDLPPALERRLPDGWDRRLFARDLRSALDRAPRPLPRAAFLRFVAGVQAQVLRRSLGGDDIPPAGFDSNVGPRLRRMMNPRGTLAGAFRTPRATLRGLMRSEPPPLPDPGRTVSVPMPDEGRVECTLRLDGSDDYANLAFRDAAGFEVPLHLSVQAASNRAALNDFRGGQWGRVMHTALDLTGRDHVDASLILRNGPFSIELDGREVWRSDSNTGRFAGLTRATHVELQGGADPATLRVTRVAPDPEPGRLVLGDRLILRGRVDGDGPVMLSVNDCETLIPVRDGATISAPLPGRLWQKAPTLTLRLVDATGTDALPPLTLTRDDILDHVERCLTDPTLVGDTEAAMLVAEHVCYARLVPDLSAQARTGLAALARHYGLADFLADGGEAPPPVRFVPPPDPDTALIDAGLARVSQALRADPPVDPATALAQIVLPPDLWPALLRTLSEVFTAPGRDPAPLFDRARELGITGWPRLDDPWIAGTSLPFLLEQGLWDDLRTALDTIAEPTGRWITTAPLGWTLMRALDRGDLPNDVTEHIIETFQTFTRDRAGDYWDRTPCRQMTRAAARLVRARPDTAAWATATYGLSPLFWVALGHGMPDELRDAYAAFETVSARSDPKAVETALDVFAANPDAPRIAREILGPSGTSVPDTAPGPDLLRHAAFPGAGPVSDAHAQDRIRATLPTLYPETPPAPDARGTEHDTLVVVFSCVTHLTTRIPAMRAGWLGALAARGIPHIVVVGGGDGTRDGDIVHLDAPDDYEGLPQKTLAAIAWVFERTDHTHMLKVDDDCFVNVDAMFDDPIHTAFDYHGRKLTRVPGQLDRTWHMVKSGSERGRYQLDRSPEPSVYADGGSGYALSRRAMAAALDAAASPQGRTLIAASFMEDKLLGDLLHLRGIAVSDAGYTTTIRRRHAAGAIPVPAWVNGFDASFVWPVRLVHLDDSAAQEQAQSRLKTPHITPKKLWPSYQPIRLGWQSNALELVSDGARVDAARDAPVTVVAAMRNEMFMLPRFLDHYRRLGVAAFAIADNLSDDGTLEYLEAQPDVAAFSVDTDYSQSRYGVAWQQALMAALRQDRWSLVADADEFLVWQRDQTQTLPDLLAGDDFVAADAARIFMLDMYPRGALSDADFTDDPFAQAGFADRDPFLVDCPTTGPYSDSPTWTSALRHRLIPGSRSQLFVAQKYALLRYHPFMRLSAGLHYVAGTRPAPRELLFAHFKYNADFRRKAQSEVARGQHFNDAEEYRKYLALMSEGRDRVYQDGVSLRWTDSPFVRARLDRT